jgi:hypothetical protein
MNCCVIRVEYYVKVCVHSYSGIGFVDNVVQNNSSDECIQCMKLKKD